MKTTGLLLAALTLAACDPGDPNGLDQVLWFDSYGYHTTVGGTGTITLLHRKRLAGGLKSLGKGLTIDRSETFRYDFAGTTLEVVPEEPGITILGTALVDGDWTTTYRCDAQTYQIVHFHVIAGTKARYEDRTYVSCDPPAQP